jgi:hypothetical protein
MRGIRFKSNQSMFLAPSIFSQKSKKNVRFSAKTTQPN